VGSQVTTTTELTNGVQGRWLGPRGIFCHNVPDVEDVNLHGEECVTHVMVTSVGGDVTGELLRWIWDDNSIGYEVRINGLEETGGTCNAAAYSYNSIANLAKVTNDLRYMWDAIANPDRRGAWSTWSGCR
jgi:hypothetical protein